MRDGIAKAPVGYLMSLMMLNVLGDRSHHHVECSHVRLRVQPFYSITLRPSCCVDKRVDRSPLTTRADVRIGPARPSNRIGRMNPSRAARDIATFTLMLQLPHLAANGLTFGSIERRDRDEIARRQHEQVNAGDTRIDPEHDADQWFETMRGADNLWMIDLDGSRVASCMCYVGSPSDVVGELTTILNDDAAALQGEGVWIDLHLEDEDENRRGRILAVALSFFFGQRNFAWVAVSCEIHDRAAIGAYERYGLHVAKRVTPEYPELGESDCIVLTMRAP
jgi:hypothetical protein